MKNTIILSILITVLCIGTFSFKSRKPILPPLPDLKVTSIIPSVLNGNLVLKIKIRNVGIANATGTFETYIELNNTSEPSPNPKRIKNRLIAGLNAHQSKTIEVVYLASEVHPNDKKVTVVVDSKDNQITESNENNNRRRVLIPSL
jgi:subtilase family serine protease